MPNNKLFEVKLVEQTLFHVINISDQSLITFQVDALRSCLTRSCVKKLQVEELWPWE